ncbi:uncharacterized protein LOC119185526, partial [Rhipicephalus microplus]|uniref:uncharacterized protein LOC119185526 n=1 Tax=Rhipicephalus microplus TaxID=6941 RepID=UPI003F6CB8AB
SCIAFFSASYGLFVASAVISAIGLAAAALCIRGAYTDQRHLLLPYLVFEGLLAVVQGVVIIIVIVAIIASIERILPDFKCHTSGCKLPWPNYKPAVHVKNLDMVNNFVSWNILTAGSQDNSEGNDEAASGHHELDGSGRWT